MYTPEELEAVALRLAGGSASTQDEVIAADVTRTYAATLKAAQGGVTDAMVERALGAAHATDTFPLGHEFTQRDRVRMRAALEAALSAQQGQGEAMAVACRYRFHDGNGGWLGWHYSDTPTRKFVEGDRVQCEPLYTAPPAQPAEAVIDFAGKGEAGPFPIKDGRIELAQVTLDDLRDRLEDTAQPEITREMWEAGRAEYANWIREMYQDGQPTEADRQRGYERAREAMLAASPAPSPARGDGGEG